MYVAGGSDANCGSDALSERAKTRRNIDEQSKKNRPKIDTKRPKIDEKSILGCFGRSESLRARSGTAPGRPRSGQKRARAAPRALLGRPAQPQRSPRAAPDRSWRAVGCTFGPSGAGGATTCVFASIFDRFFDGKLIDLFIHFLDLLRSMFNQFLIDVRGQSLQQRARSDTRPTSTKHCKNQYETHFGACAQERNEERKAMLRRSQKRSKSVRKNDKKSIENAIETSIGKAIDKSINNRSKIDQYIIVCGDIWYSQNCTDRGDV